MFGSAVVRFVSSIISIYTSHTPLTLPRRPGSYLLARIHRSRWSSCARWRTCFFLLLPLCSSLVYRPPRWFGCRRHLRRCWGIWWWWPRRWWWFPVIELSITIHPGMVMPRIYHSGSNSPPGPYLDFMHRSEPISL
jgi:hypothetical protein